MTTTTPAPTGDTNRLAALGKLLDAANTSALTYLQSTDADAAVQVQNLRHRQLRQPTVVICGETKRGKSSLINALVGVPGLSPVDAAVATTCYVELTPGDTPSAEAWIPGHEQPVPLPVADLRNWATALGALPDGMRPPRRVRVRHPAPLLRYLRLVDTPGAGGLDPVHAQIALDAVSQATALLYVADASAPLSQPELDFLIEASKQVNLVVFALTKIDAYPGWRTILADNQQLLRTKAPRFATAGWYPVSARLAELAMTLPEGTGADLVAASQVGPLQQALIGLAGQGHLLHQANVLRTLRSELVRLDAELGERIRATDPDERELTRAREQRAALTARKRTESRQWSLALNTETQRARVEATGRLRGYLSALQEDFLTRIDAARGNQLATLPQQVDRALHAVSIRLSRDLDFRFRKLAQRTLAQVFDPEQLRFVLGRLNATLRHALSSKPRREAPGADNVMIAMSAGGMAFMAGRGAMAGASALGAGALLGGGLLIPAAGLGLGLAAGAFILHRRRVANDRQQARVWLREVVTEARAALADEITHRFTDLQYALTLALDDAIERRLRQLDEHISGIDAALAQDKAQRTARRGQLQSSRDTLRARIKQVDEVLVRARALQPAPARGGHDE